MDRTTKDYVQKLQNALRSSYGYVKAHEYEGTTKALLAKIEQLIPEVSIQDSLKGEQVTAGANAAPRVGSNQEGSNRTGSSDEEGCPDVSQDGVHGLGVNGKNARNGPSSSTQTAEQGKFDLAFVLRDCGGNIEAAQRRIDRALEQARQATPADATQTELMRKLEDAADILADGLSDDKHCTADENGDRCHHCRAIKWLDKYEASNG